jgi:amidase
MEYLTHLSAAQAAKALQTQQIRSIDLVNGVLDRIEKENPSLNAIVTLDPDHARQQAMAADDALEQGKALGPLHGLPITIKDSFETAGMRTVSGFAPFRNHIPMTDAAPVARLRKAGSVILGKTNLPTLASGIQSNNPVFGRTNNPWDITRTPGGSSGGAAAAISARLSYLELGSDIGGSIRIPAHFCGLYALKCTGGRVSGKGHLSSTKRLEVPQGWEALLQLASMGPIARSIEDLRLAFPIIAEPGTPGLEAQPVKPLAELRIAWTDDFGGAPLDSESRRLMQSFAGQLAQAGCQVEHCSDAGFDYEEAWFIAGACLGTINTLFQPPLMQQFRKLIGPLMARPGAHPLQRGLYMGVTLKSQTVLEILKKRERLIERIESFLGKWDAWICPVFPTPAFTHRKPDAPIDVDDKPFSQLLANLLHNILFNVSGNPVVTLPMGMTHPSETKPALPVGVQVVGRRWQEQALLNTAEQLAIVTPGYQSPPETIARSGEKIYNI